MICVIIAEDHNLVRQGIRALLEKADDIEVLGEAADGWEAIELTERLKPDVLVMDIAMPRLNGIQTTQSVCAQEFQTQVVILSMHSDKPLVLQALRSGAKGYLLKRSVGEELLLAIRAASRGEVYLCPAISGYILDDVLAGQTDAEGVDWFDLLTPREHEVMQLMTEGRTNRAIAQILGISIRTVEKHRARLMSKLNVSDTANLTRIALKHGLVFFKD